MKVKSGFLAEVFKSEKQFDAITSGLYLNIVQLGYCQPLEL